MATQPDYLASAFCTDGVKQYPIPNTSTVGSGRASLTAGFPDETSQPIDDGGIPPQRKDFNGILYMLSTFALFEQSGGKFTWDSRVNYDVPSIIYYNGELWWCVSASGPNVAGVGAKTPSDENVAYWKKVKDLFYTPLDSYPVGSYYISSNSTNPANLPGFEGSTWVQVQNRMILAAGSSYTAGSTGGSATKTLTVANMPEHSHTCSTTGVHTHAPGTMNITGSFNAVTQGAGYASGAFTGRSVGNGDEGDVSGELRRYTLNAKDSWTGKTAEAGDHKHTIGKAGSGTAFNIMPPYIVAYVWRRTA